MAIRKILVVDDSDVDRSTLVRLLNTHNYTTVEAKDGNEGVEKAKSELPDLILMDVVMPNLSGFEATRIITTTEETKHIPVIICSSKGLKTDAMWGRRQGAKEYMVKPVNPEELLEKVKMFDK